jgi:DNA sulfur modification protein DndE
MYFNKIRLSVDASSKLRSMRQRVQITPNLLCRVALMTSLEEGPVASAPAPDQEGIEMNQSALTGEYDSLFEAFLRFVEEGAAGEKLSDAELLQRLRAHLHRGIGTLAVRVKSPLEFARLARVD